jgi:glutamate-1-semialdehyde aminotransferase
VEETLRRGASFGAPTELETQLAELIIDAVPSIEMMRMVNSGTEASMSAIQLARGFTGRDVIVKFAGCYHGHVDGLLAEAGSGLATQGIPASTGVTRAQAGDTLVAGWNDVEALEAAMKAAGSELAAVIAEPVPANMGVVPPEEGFLEALRGCCDECGALLVLDEVITGFRVAGGGAQERYGVRSDLTLLGKVLGGGLPLAEPLAADLRSRWLADPRPLVFDADALGCTSATAAGPRVLTPHAGEAARLLGRSVAGVQDDRFGAVAELQSRGTVLLKGEVDYRSGGWSDRSTPLRYGFEEFFIPEGSGRDLNIERDQTLEQLEEHWQKAKANTKSTKGTKANTQKA